jgi:hypothetical protein
MARRNPPPADPVPRRLQSTVRALGAQTRLLRTDLNNGASDVALHRDAMICARLAIRVADMVLEELTPDREAEFAALVAAFEAYQP